MEKVIFLDRDGTLNVEVNYLHRKEDLVLLPGVPEALKAFKDQGYKLVVITPFSIEVVLFSYPNVSE